MVKSMSERELLGKKQIRSVRKLQDVIKASHQAKRESEVTGFVQDPLRNNQLFSGIVLCYVVLPYLPVLF